MNQLVEQEWLSTGEKQIACQLAVKLSGYGHLPCYSVGEIREEMIQGKSQAIYKYTNGSVMLAPNSTIDLGNVYVVAKSRSVADFVTSPLCDNGIHCLRKTINLGQSGRIADTLTGEHFYVDGMLAVELAGHDFHSASTHLLNEQKPTFVVFVGHLMYRDYVPTRKGYDTLAFVLRLQNASLIYP